MKKRNHLPKMNKKSIIQGNIYILIYLG